MIHSLIISEAIVKGFQSTDDSTVKEVIQRADELITKVKKDKEDLIDKEDGGDGDEDLPKTKTGTVVILSFWTDRFGQTV